MTIAEYEIIISVVVAAVLAFGPWMLMVHSKLAVLVAKTAELCDKVEKAAEAQQQLWQQIAEHEARLDRLDVQIGYLDERVHEIEP